MRDPEDSVVCRILYLLDRIPFGENLLELFVRNNRQPPNLRQELRRNLDFDHPQLLFARVRRAYSCVSSFTLVGPRDFIIGLHTLSDGQCVTIWRQLGWVVIRRENMYAQTIS